MLDSITRHAKEITLNPIARLLDSIHPNHITLASVIPGLLCAWFAYQGLFVWAIGMWAANRVLDGLDGTLARRQGNQSDFGGYLDILIDFTIYAIVPIGIVLWRPEQANWIALVFLFAVYYVNAASWMYLSSILEKRSSGAKTSSEMTSITMPTGIIEGTETVIAYFLFLLFPSYIVWLFPIFAVLVGATIIQRLVWAREVLSDK